MSGSHENKTLKIGRNFVIHFPTPYGCVGLAALILGAMTTVVLSLFAIGMAILKYRGL